MNKNIVIKVVLGFSLNSHFREKLLSDIVPYNEHTLYALGAVNLLVRNLVQIGMYILIKIGNMIKSFKVYLNVQTLSH